MQRMTGMSHTCVVLLSERPGPQEERALLRHTQAGQAPVLSGEGPGGFLVRWQEARRQREEKYHRKCS